MVLKMNDLPECLAYLGGEDADSVEVYSLYDRAGRLVGYCGLLWRSDFVETHLRRDEDCVSGAFSALSAWREGVDYLKGLCRARGVRRIVSVSEDGGDLDRFSRFTKLLGYTEVTRIAVVEV